jgi:hypothetical protein
MFVCVPPIRNKLSGMNSSSLPPGWAAIFDARYQQYYYVNASQGISQWEPPKMPSTNELKPLGELVTEQHQHHQLASATCSNATEATTTPPVMASNHNTSDAREQQFWYHDPKGNLRGPFSADQLTQWRPFLPMDLVLLLQAPRAAMDINGGSSSCSINGTQATLDQIDAERSSSATEAGQELAIQLHPQQQQQQQGTGSQQQGTSSQQQGTGSQQQRTGSQQQQDQVQVQHQRQTNSTDLAMERAVQAPAVAIAAAAAAAPAAHDGCTSSSAVVACGASAALANSTRPDQGCQDGSCNNSGSTTQRLYLADLMGDGHLLLSWQQSVSQQQQQQWPQKAVAPPAPVWEAWCSSCGSSSGAAAAVAATTSGDRGSWVSRTAHEQQGQQQPQHASQHELMRELMSYSTTSAAASTASNLRSSSSSGFEKYAAAVLQGLPAHDEAVQLANLAVAHGRSLQEVLQSTAASCAATATVGTLDDRITYEQKPGLGGVLLVKDPRSGRLTAAGNTTAATATAARDSANDLYGDLARWCDPRQLEQSLQRASQSKRQAQDKQQQPQGLTGAGGSGASEAGKVVGGSKRMRLSI